MEYHIAMGVRANEPEWRRRINTAILKRQGEITAILRGLRRPVAQRARPARLSLRVAANVGEEGGSAPSPRFVLIGEIGLMPDARARRLSLGRLPRTEPETVPGGVVIDTEAAYKLWEAAVPSGSTSSRHRGAPRICRRRHYGCRCRVAIFREACGCRTSAAAPSAPSSKTFFHTHLEDAVKGVRDRPIVFYCLADCWMSWNATKRAASWGYRRLYWYRDGIDAWEPHRCRPRTPSPSRGRDCESTPICHSKAAACNARAQAPRRASRSTGAWHA